jgi:hypothetical protein
VTRPRCHSLRRCAALAIAGLGAAAFPGCGASDLPLPGSAGRLARCLDRQGVDAAKTLEVLGDPTALANASEDHGRRLVRDAQRRGRLGAKEARIVARCLRKNLR